MSGWVKSTSAKLHSQQRLLRSPTFLQQQTCGQFYNHLKEKEQKAIDISHNDIKIIYFTTLEFCTQRNMLTLCNLNIGSAKQTHNN